MAFRYVLGSLDQPLCGYALFHAAEAKGRGGDRAEARQILGELGDLGCAARATPGTLDFAIRASVALGVDARDAGRHGVRRRGATGPLRRARGDDARGASDR
jgi:hypothetical protein